MRASGNEPSSALSPSTPSGSRLVAKTRRCQPVRHFASLSYSGQAKNETAGSSPAFRSNVRGGVAKTARHLPAKQIIGSAILPTASRFC